MVSLLGPGKVVNIEKRRFCLFWHLFLFSNYFWKSLSCNKVILVHWLPIILLYLTHYTSNHAELLSKISSNVSGVNCCRLKVLESH